MIENTDRVLIVAPHPDDEALSSAKVIMESVKKGAEVYIIFVTSGEHNTDTMLKFAPIPVISSYLLAYKRYKEALAASKILGVPKDHLVFLGYPDFGMMKI
ncbi:MAG: PIG-L family deacetylase, partial [archaeon]